MGFNAEDDGPEQKNYNAPGPGRRNTTRITLPVDMDDEYMAKRTSAHIMRKNNAQGNKGDVQGELSRQSKVTKESNDVLKKPINSQPGTPGLELGGQSQMNDRRKRKMAREQAQASRNQDLQSTNPRQGTEVTNNFSNLLKPNQNPSKSDPLVDFVSKERANRNAGRSVPNLQLNMNTIKESEEYQGMSSDQIEDYQRPSTDRNQII